MTMEFKEMELPTAKRLKTKINPLHGSVVNARDSKIGMCLPHVFSDTSHKASKHIIIKSAQAMSHTRRNNILFKKYQTLYTIFMCSRGLKLFFYIYDCLCVNPRVFLYIFRKIFRLKQWISLGCQLLFQI